MNRFYLSAAMIFIVFSIHNSGTAYGQAIAFGYTGKIQTYLVPKNVEHIYIDLQGAPGGSTLISRGGGGGRVQCELAVTPGDILYVNIGSAGNASTGMGVRGGYNGGGAGSEDAGGGGGASDIRRGGMAMSNRVIVAGGGGGGCGATSVTAKNYDRGGDGGGLAGEAGYNNGTNNIFSGKVAGIGGTAMAQKNADMRTGIMGRGGNGYADYVGGGGGGGGYFGGSGGNENGGGGGSSYTDPILVSAVVHTQGYNVAGDGAMTIMPVKKEVAAQDEEITPDSTFQPHGSMYASVFCDIAYKSHADTVLEGRSGLSQYAKVPANTSLFQFRRIYLGYRYDISTKFSAEILLAAEDDFSSPYSATSGDLLSNNKLAPFIKLANLRWKNIFKGSDLVMGQVYTPAFHATSEDAWAYRSIARTLTDIYRTNEYDMGISLQGHLPGNDKLGYNLLVGNGSGAKPEANSFKWFYGDVYYKLFNKKVIVDFFADYEKLTWTTTWHRDRQMNKLFIAYTVPKITVGVEVFTNRLMGDCIATRTDGITTDTITTKRNAVSIFAHGSLYKDKVGFFVRYDQYAWGNKNNNTVFESYNDQTTYYDHNTRQDFVTLGLDFAPYKNVHIMPNIWYNYYQNVSPASYGGTNADYDLVYRLTVSYQFGK